MLIGYGRVSTEDQNTSSQYELLTAAGCAMVFEETASGGDRHRPELREALSRIQPGDTLVVTRIDRLARSLGHLLEVIETLRKKGAHFRSLADPIDTSSPQGVFTLQVLGAAAEFERALIRERTKAGLASARAKGRVGGNPGLRARDPDAIRKLRDGRRIAELERLEASAHMWLPTVERLRPMNSWDEVVREVERAHPAGAWNKAKLLRSVKRLVGAGQAKAELLQAAPRRPRLEKTNRVIETIGSILTATPDMNLEAMALKLKHSGIRTKSGDRDWPISTLGRAVAQARAAGLAPAKPEGRRRTRQGQ